MKRRPAISRSSLDESEHLQEGEAHASPWIGASPDRSVSMTPREATRPALQAQVCLLLEGTYPYVAGGVSSWVHCIISNLPELSFALLHIGAQRGAYGPARYTLPANVAGLSEVYCQTGPSSGPLDLATREQLEGQIRGLRRRTGPPPAS